MDTLSIATTVAAILISLLLLSQWRRRHGRNAARGDAPPALDTVQAWPPKAMRVLGGTQLLALLRLQQAAPGCLVLARVPLSRFISVPAQNSYGEWMNRVGSLCVDLMLCDARAKPIAVVEIFSGRESVRRQRRHERMADVLRAAGIAVHRWEAHSLPSADEVKALFAAAVTTRAAETERELIGPGGQHLLPVPEMQELSADEEAFALASTGFGDLDALHPQEAKAAVR